MCKVILTSSTQQITVNDEEGSLQWTEGWLTIPSAADIEGNILFEGPINTPNDRSKFPLPSSKDCKGRNKRTTTRFNQ